MITKGVIKNEVYAKYFKAEGSWFICCIIPLMFIAAQFICSANDYWTMYWTHIEFLRQKVSSENATNNMTSIEDPFLLKLGELGRDQYGLPRTSTFIYVYTLFILVVIAISFIKCFLFVTINLAASRRLHNQMFQAVLTATMQFFHKNPSGKSQKIQRIIETKFVLFPKVVIKF